ncbi:ankyrin repeat-containing domain protein [Baffinella frigidus]|nr:ankyrin repeat-containing domain protein [Cryptophyta sp. CCMP2293]
MNAAAEGETDTVKLLIASGADRHFVKKSTGDTLVILAAAYARHETLAYLLSLPEAGIDTQNNSGFSALSYTASGDDIEIVKMLLDHGAKVEMVSDIGGTPLMSACAAGNVDIAALLLDRGASVSSLTGDGSTPLHTAVSSGDRNVVELLLSRGADTNATDDQNLDPLGVAESVGMTIITDMIRRAIDKRAQCHAFAMGQQKLIAEEWSRIRFTTRIRIEKPTTRPY